MDFQVIVSPWQQLPVTAANETIFNSTCEMRRILKRQKKDNKKILDIFDGQGVVFRTRCHEVQTACNGEPGVMLRTRFHLKNQVP